eukprot:8340788-Alexandrium_andersonii.AAC.1
MAPDIITPSSSKHNTAKTANNNNDTDDTHVWRNRAAVSEFGSPAKPPAARGPARLPKGPPGRLRGRRPPLGLPAHPSARPPACLPTGVASSSGDGGSSSRWRVQHKLGCVPPAH